jgi:hypothetical protein
MGRLTWFPAMKGRPMPKRPNPVPAFPLKRWLLSLFAWRTYEESWAWIHQRNAVTGAERHIPKVRGVPMAPPPTPNSTPPRPNR